MGGRVDFLHACTHNHTMTGVWAPALGKTCTAVRECRSQCCSRCATQTGRRIQSFAELVRQEPSRVEVLTVGNSVAETANYATSRAFIDAARAAFPRTEFRSNVGKVLGGYEPQHFYHWMRTFPSLYSKYSLVIVQYMELVGKRHAEAAIRLLLSLPQAPTVVLVEHCVYQVMDNCTQAFNSSQGSRKYCSDGYLRHSLRELQMLWSLAKRYDLPVISNCKAFGELLQPKCAEDRATASWQPRDVRQHLFYDFTHYVERGALIAGCLLADLLLSPPHALPDHPEPDPKLPPSMEGDEKYLPAFMNTTADGSLSPNGSGWTLGAGGKGGRKMWLGADIPGATLRFRTPACTNLALELYRHHELAMGLIHVTIDGESFGTVDACCSGPCVPGAHGQGMYQTVTIGESLRLAAHDVELTLVDRSRTECLLLGHRFHLVSLIGRVEARGPDYNQRIHPWVQQLPA